jgi:hypothetical protein
MRKDAALRILCDYQARIRAQIASDRALLDAEGEAARPVLAQRRWILARLLREYQLFKHVELFDPALARDDRLGVVARLKTRCTAIGDRFAAYLACWTSPAIDGHWTHYAAATHRMFDALDRHVEQERRAIEAMLAGVERIERPRARPPCPARAPQARPAVQ